MNSHLEHYLQLPYRVEVYPDDAGNGYTAVIPDLPGCISGGDTPQEALASIEEAKRLWLEVAVTDGDPIPEPAPVVVEKFSGKFLVRAPRSLHRRLIKRAEAEGVSLNQLVVSILSESMGRSLLKESYAVQLQAMNRAFSKHAFTWSTLHAIPESEYPLNWGAQVEIQEVALPPSHVMSRGAR